MNTKVIIQASSNPVGNTHKIIQVLNKNNNFDVIDLATKKINHFDYNFENANDDFLPIIKKIIKQYDTVIFATPVYWYSMSGILKVFFDRFSDLLINQKELGRQLRGKKMAILSNSKKDDLKNGFTMPFIETSKYLGTQYLGDIHIWFTEKGEEIHSDALNKLYNFKNIFDL